MRTEPRQQNGLGIWPLWEGRGQASSGSSCRSEAQRPPQREVGALTRAYGIDVRLGHPEVAVQVGIAGVAVAVTVRVATEWVRPENAVVEGAGYAVAVAVADAIARLVPMPQVARVLRGSAGRRARAPASGRGRRLDRVAGEADLRGIELADDGHRVFDRL